MSLHQAIMECPSDILRQSAQQIFDRVIEVDGGHTVSDKDFNRLLKILLELRRRSLKGEKE